MIVAISPHPDDVEYGCWTTLRALAHANDIVLVTVADDPTRRAEALEAANLIGADYVWLDYPDRKLGHHLPTIISSFEFQLEYADWVFCPSPHDSHQDHRAIARAVDSATRRLDINVAHYATPTTSQTFAPNAFTPITEIDVYARRTALDCHSTQSDRPYFTDQALETKDRWFGSLARLPKAEPIAIQRLTLEGT